MTNTIPTTTHRPSREEVSAAAERALELQAEIAERQAELDEIKLQMQLWPFDKYASEHALVQVQAARRRDDEAFQDAFPFEAFPHLYKFVPDTTAIKNEIAPVDLEPFMRQQAPRIVVKAL